MPSTYTHFKFAQAVADELPDRLRRVTERYKTYYLTGAHGPDILFYYHPLGKNAVNSVGFGMHTKSAAPFFRKAKELIPKSCDPEAALAYILGFITHFVLDSACHGYVAEKIAASGATHTEIEVELDRDLLIADGKDPLRTRLTEHIRTEREYAEVIAPFFSLTAAQVQRALKDMKKFNNILVAPGKLKRALILCILRFSGNYKEMHGLLIGRKANPVCADSCRILREKMRNNVPLAVRLIQEYADDPSPDHPLDDYFERNYE